MINKVILLLKETKIMFFIIFYINIQLFNRKCDDIIYDEHYLKQLKITWKFGKKVISSQMIYPLWYTVVVFKFYSVLR